MAQAILRLTAVCGDSQLRITGRQHGAFRVTNAHADSWWLTNCVPRLEKVSQLEHDAIIEITGDAGRCEEVQKHDRPLQQRTAAQRIVVTVDLLTTGVDIPVHLQYCVSAQVKETRILCSEQMKGARPRCVDSQWENQL